MKKLLMSMAAVAMLSLTSCTPLSIASWNVVITEAILSEGTNNCPSTYRSESNDGLLLLLLLFVLSASSPVMMSSKVKL